MGYASRHSSETMVIYFIIILLTICADVFAQNGIGAPYQKLTQVMNLSAEKPELKDRFYSVSTTSPVTQYIRNHSEQQAEVNKTFNFIDSIWNVVQDRREQKSPDACNLLNLSPTSWNSRVREMVKHYQIGEIDGKCYSQIDLMAAVKTKEISADIVQKASDVFKKGRLAFAEAYKQLKLVPDTNWTGISYDMPTRNLTISGQKCSIDSILAHRRERIWYLRAVVTNAPIRKTKKDYTRHYMQEFVPREGSTALQMPMFNINETDVIENATTIVAKFGGSGLSVWSESIDDPQSALHHAYRDNLVAVDLASDAITPSNIAILALPMAMNIIPFSFVSEVSALNMFIYVIVTDVFSTFPFLIKGVELIRSSRPQKEVFYAFFSGNETLGTMESWIVQCTGRERFRLVGISFVSIAISAIVIGISLELWAKRYLSRKFLESKDPRRVRGPFGMTRLQPELLLPFNSLKRRIAEQDTTTDTTSARQSQSLERDV